MRTTMCALAIATMAACSAPAFAEIVVPNPLIKPQQITPVGAPQSSPSGGLPGSSRGMGPPMLPELPISSGQRELSGAKASGQADVESVRTSLARYEVVFVSAAYAVLKLNLRPVGGGQAPGQGVTSAGASAVDRAGPGQLTLRDQSTLKFAGYTLRARIDGDTVELYRPSGKSDDDHEVSMFFGALSPSSTPAYVPETSKLEKPDTRYQNSIKPDAARAAGGSSDSGRSSNGSSPDNN